MTSKLAKSWKWAVATAAVFVPASVLAVSVPNTFTAGTPIVAAAMNQNFTTLEAAVTAVESDVTDLQSDKQDAPGKGAFAPALRGKMTYLWSGSCFNSTTPNCQPPSQYVHTTESATPTITRTAAGAYTVNIGTALTGGGHVQVTAYGTNANQCKIMLFAGTSVSVRCYTPAGALSDTHFNLLIVN